MRIGAGSISRTASVRVLVLAALLAGCTPPSESARPRESPALALPWPTPETAPFDPSQFGWRRVVDDVGQSGEVIGPALLVGRLSEKEPTARIPLIESPWSFSLSTIQTPAAAGPAGGNVLYVSDDGVSSELRVIGVDGTDDRPVGTLPQVVFAAALSPEGGNAYLILLDRATGRDEGVFAVATNGSGEVRRVMGPPTGSPAARGVGIVLAAVSRFVRSLHASPDGHHLARLACGAFACGLDVLDVDTGAVESLHEPAILEFYGIVDGIVVGLFDCRNPACGDAPRIEAVELATNIRIPIGVDVGTLVAPGGDGRLILLGQAGAALGNPAPEIRGTDVRTGATKILLALDGVMLPQPDPRLGVEVPWGWQWIGICPEGCLPFGLNLSDGSQVPLIGLPF